MFARQGMQKIDLPPDTKAIRDICILPRGHAAFASLGRKLSLFRSVKKVSVLSHYCLANIYSDIWPLCLCFISQHGDQQCCPSIQSTGDSLTFAISQNLQVLLCSSADSKTATKSLFLHIFLPKIFKYNRWSFLLFKARYLQVYSVSICPVVVSLGLGYQKITYGKHFNLQNIKKVADS